MADPFEFSPADPNAQGFLGQSPEFWRNIAAFGSNLATSANARTASGHLANGTGLAGPLGAATTQTMEFGRQNAISRSTLAKQGAETRGLTLQNRLMELGMPFQEALTRARMGALQDMGGQTGAPQGGLQSGLAASESGGRPGAVNSAGFSGAYQFGAPRLAELGLYTPGQGETGNQWTGTFNIPGFPDVKTQADFLKNQQAQNAAYGMHMANIDQAIAKTTGASGMDPNGLRAVAHLGGVRGMQRFIQTGGQYDPADSNGTKLSDYYRKFSGAGAASPASGPRVALLPQQAPQGANPNAPQGGPVGPNGIPLPPGMAGQPRYTPPTASQSALQQAAPSPPGQPPASTAPAAPPVPPLPPAAAPQATAPQQQAGPRVGVSPEIQQQASALQQEAAHYEQLANRAALLGNGIGGDPTVLRQTAMEKRKLADQLLTAGPLAGVKAGAEGDVKLRTAGPIAGAESAARLPALLAEKGFVLGPDGKSMAPIQGGPADPNYVGAKVAAEKAAEAQVALQTAGPIAGAKAAATAAIKPETDRYGNMYVRNLDGSWTYLGRGSEVKPEFDPATGREHYGDIGGVGIGAQPPGVSGPVPGGTAGAPLPGPRAEGATAPAPSGFGPIAKLSPAETGRLTAAGQIEGHDLEHDRKMIEQDLSHVVDTTIQAKTNLLKLRDLTDPAQTGFGANTLLGAKNFLQTWAPRLADAINVDANPGQEFKKISTMGAGKAEREDQGARGGLRLMQIYMEANPNLENQPGANKHMANMLLMAHQLHEDYAVGANDFYQRNREGLRGDKHDVYKPISQYDQVFIQKMRPEVYKSATDALNGKPYTEWSKGLTASQMQLVGGILQRADPNAQIDISGRMVPVTAFTKVIGPTDIMGGGGGR